MYKVKVYRNKHLVSNYEVKYESVFWKVYTWFTNLGYKVEVYQNNNLILGR